MLDAKICPFCKQDNNCQAHVPNNNCWCNEIKVPLELRDLVPEELKMKSCICKDCIQLYKSEKVKFTNKYLL